MVFSTGCDAGLSGWYLMFCAGQYVVGELSELPGRSGYASWLSLRPLSGAKARPLELLFTAERMNSSAFAQSFQDTERYEFPSSKYSRGHNVTTKAFLQFLECTQFKYIYLTLKLNVVVLLPFPRLLQNNRNDHLH